MTKVPAEAESEPPQSDAARSARPQSGADARVPRLADIELIGEFADSGFKEPPFIARRSDGQVVQLPVMLYCAVTSFEPLLG